MHKGSDPEEKNGTSETVKGGLCGWATENKGESAIRRGWRKRYMQNYVEPLGHGKYFFFRKMKWTSFQGIYA